MKSKETEEVINDVDDADIFGYTEKMFIDNIHHRVFNRTVMGFENDDYPMTNDAAEFIRTVATHLERSGCPFECF